MLNVWMMKIGCGKKGDGRRGTGIHVTHLQRRNNNHNDNNRTETTYKDTRKRIKDIEREEEDIEDSAISDKQIQEGGCAVFSSPDVEEFVRRFCCGYLDLMGRGEVDGGRTILS